MRLTTTLAVVALNACGVHEDPVGDGQTPDPGGSDPAACEATMSEQLARLGGALEDWPITDAAEMRYDPSLAQSFDAARPGASFDGHYRADVDGTGLEQHPGCTTESLYYGTAAGSPNDPVWYPLFALRDEAPGELWRDASAHFRCAAKHYAGIDDSTRPVVLLIQGNSVRPHTWERFVPPDDWSCIACAEYGGAPDTSPRPQLAEKLVERGFGVLAVDLRPDMISRQFGALGAPLNSIDCESDPDNNCAHNMDHGWATPIVQNLVEAALLEYAGQRPLAIVGHSMGVTAARDALRRIYLRYRDPGDTWDINPFAHVQDVILLSGANHGVSTYDGVGGLRYCDDVPNMKGKVVCEMGSRNNYQPTYFTRGLNGPEGLYETPCADGQFAFGDREACTDALEPEGNVVQYTTITMRDLPDGTQQDEYVSEASSALGNGPCAENATVALMDFDTSGYLVKVNHFGSARSDGAHALILERLED